MPDRCGKSKGATQEGDDVCPAGKIGLDGEKQRQCSGKTGVKQQKSGGNTAKNRRATKRAMLFAEKKEKRQNKSIEERRKIGRAQRTMKTAKQKAKKSLSIRTKKAKDLFERLGLPSKAFVPPFFCILLQKNRLKLFTIRQKNGIISFGLILFITDYYREEDKHVQKNKNYGR